MHFKNIDNVTCITLSAVRVVMPQVPGVSHHITQRAVRRMDTFFDDGDYETYLSLMHERTGRPLGDEQFIAQLPEQTGRKLGKRKPGPKPKS